MKIKSTNVCIHIFSINVNKLYLYLYIRSILVNDKGCGIHPNQSDTLNIIRLVLVLMLYWLTGTKSTMLADEYLSSVESKNRVRISFKSI